MASSTPSKQTTKQTNSHSALKNISNTTRTNRLGEIILKEELYFKKCLELETEVIALRKNGAESNFE